MACDQDSFESEKELVTLLDNLPMEVDIPKNIYLLLTQAGQSIAMKIARNFLDDDAEQKKSVGLKIVMHINGEENVDLLLPLLDENNTLLRWQAVYYITRTKKFLDGTNDIILDRIIKTLLDDASPLVRVEVAEALGYCSKTSKTIPVLEFVRNHDFEFDENGYRVSTIAGEAINRIKGMLAG